MGQVPAAEKSTRRRRPKAPRVGVRLLVAIAVFAPGVAVVPDPWDALAVIGAIVAAVAYGYHEGRADLSRDLILRHYR